MVSEYKIKPSFRNSLPWSHPAVGIRPVIKHQKTLPLFPVLRTHLEDGGLLTGLGLRVLPTQPVSLLHVTFGIKYHREKLSCCPH